MLDQIKYTDNTLLNYSVNFSVLEKDSPFELHKQVNELILKFGDSKTLNFLSRKLLRKRLSKFFECKANYTSVNDVEHLKIVEIGIAKMKLTEQLKITFGNYFNHNQLGDIGNVHESISELIESFEFNTYLQSFNEILKNKILPLLKLSSKEFEHNILFLKKLPLYIEHEEIKTFLFACSEKIKDHAKQHPLIDLLSGSIFDVNRSSYELYLHEYVRLKGKLDLSIRFQKIQSTLLKVIPKTASQIIYDLRQRQVPLTTANAVEKDIFLLKVTNFLNTTLTEFGDSGKLFSELQTIKKNIETKTADLIIAKTWFDKVARFP